MVQFKPYAGKFQALAVGKQTRNASPILHISDVNITIDDTVKLLGVDIDFMLCFNDQSSKLCRKVAM